MYKELLSFNNKKKTNPIKDVTYTKDLNSYFSKGNSQTHKRMLKLLVIIEMQIKTR